MTDNAPPAPAATPWRLVLMLGALTAFAPMSIDMYLSSMPDIGRSLHAGADDVQATLAAFFAGMTFGGSRSKSNFMVHSRRSAGFSGGLMKA